MLTPFFLHQMLMMIPKCIAKEADLIYELLTSCSDWDTTELIASGNQIRRSALNLVKVSESAAVAGAMLVCICLHLPLFA
jgi:hypothetical protein